MDTDDEVVSQVSLADAHRILAVTCVAPTFEHSHVPSSVPGLLPLSEADKAVSEEAASNRMGVNRISVHTPRRASASDRTASRAARHKMPLLASERRLNIEL